MHFNCHSFIGKNNPNFWSQYWENEPDEIEISASKGHLFGLIGIHTDTPNPDLNLVGRSIIEDFTTTYYSHQGAISQAILDSVSSIKPSLIFDSQFSLLICVVRFPHIYFYSCGPDHVFLLRNFQFSHLLNQSSAGLVITGNVEQNDKFLLISDPFLNSLTQDTLKKNLSLSFSEIEDNFSSHLFSLDNQNGFSSLLIQIQADVPPLPSATVSAVHPPSQPEYLHHSDVSQIARRKKISLILAIIILLLLAVSVFYSYRKNLSQLTETKYQNLKTSLEEKIATATNVKNLDLDTSLVTAKEAQKIYQELISLKIHQDQYQSFDDQIQKLLTKSGSDQIFPGKFLYDTTDINRESKYSRIYFANSKIYLLDNQSNRVDEIDASKKSHRLLSSADTLKTATKLLIDQNSIFVLADNQLSQIAGDQSVKNISFSDFTVIDIAVWNNSFYLLTPSTIYKLSSNQEGFSAPRIWLKDGQTLPSDPVSLAINGNIWILSKNGQVAPYSLGTRQQFKTGPVPQFTQVHHLVTTLNQDLLAFIDGDSYVYVYKKDGLGISKYNFGSTKILDIVFDPSVNFIYVLGADQKIYTVDL